MFPPWLKYSEIILHFCGPDNLAFPFVQNHFSEYLLTNENTFDIWMQIVDTFPYIINSETNAYSNEWVIDRNQIPSCFNALENIHRNKCLYEFGWLEATTKQSNTELCSQSVMVVRIFWIGQYKKGYQHDKLSYNYTLLSSYPFSDQCRKSIRKVRFSIHSFYS